MISNDTWPMHLAPAMWTKTIWLFGPNTPERFGAWPLDKNINLYKGNWKVYIKVMKWEFKEDKERNIEKIEVKDVMEVISLYLKTFSWNYNQYFFSTFSISKRIIPIYFFIF